MDHNDNDNYLQEGNPNELPEYDGDAFSELSLNDQEAYAEDYGFTALEAEKHYDSWEEQETRMKAIEQYHLDEIEEDRFNRDY